MKDNPDYKIIEVWSSNLEEEFRKIRKIIQKYKYVAMDTEFPGVVARIGGDFKSPDYQYQCLKCNVDLLKIIQLGFTFMDEKGAVPAGNSTFQFNFHFNINEDMYAQESIDLLSKSGIMFQKNLESGIDPGHFAELLTTSGVVLMDNVTWISFHSSYDFGYLIKLLTNKDLPNTEAEFLELMRIFFPNVFDIKYLMKSCRNLKGGLEEVARQLEIERFGPQHQAGSDSLLTGLTFFKLKEMYFEDTIDEAKYCGHLFGLGSSNYQQNGMYTSQSSAVVPGDGGYIPPSSHYSKSLVNAAVSASSSSITMTMTPIVQQQQPPQQPTSATVTAPSAPAAAVPTATTTTAATTASTTTTTTTSTTESKPSETPTTTTAVAITTTTDTTPSPPVVAAANSSSPSPASTAVAEVPTTNGSGAEPTSTSASSSEEAK